MVAVGKVSGLEGCRLEVGGEGALGHEGPVGSEEQEVGVGGTLGWGSRRSLGQVGAPGGLDGSAWGVTRAQDQLTRSHGKAGPGEPGPCLPLAWAYEKS